MFPVLFEVGDFQVTSFGVMMFFSFLGGAWVLSNQLKQRGFDPELAWDFLLWIALGGIVGAKLYYNALHWEELKADPFGELTNRAGLVWYGGLIGGVLAYWWQVKRRGLPMAQMFDATAPALFLAYAIGRMGCFLVGDDYGLPTDSWVGIAFPNGAPPSTAGYLRTVGAEIPATVPDSTVLAVHPTQLYEVAAGLFLFFVMMKLSKKNLLPGRLWALFLAFYGVERFFVEFVRAKSDRLLLGLSTSQLASVLLLAIAAYIWTRAGRVAETKPTGTAPSSPRGAARAGAGRS